MHGGHDRVLGGIGLQEKHERGLPLGRVPETFMAVATGTSAKDVLWSDEVSGITASAQLIGMGWTAR
jgi:hypothetical protein